MKPKISNPGGMSLCNLKNNRFQDLKLYPVAAVFALQITHKVLIHLGRTLVTLFKSYINTPRRGRGV